MLKACIFDLDGTLCNTLESMSSVEEGFFAEGSGLIGTEAYREGWFTIQDESSMLAVCAMDPQPGETVVDVCAAPGSKLL